MRQPFHSKQRVAWQCMPDSRASEPAGTNEEAKQHEAISLGVHNAERF
ncbi:MAG: hypothetical protein GXY83_09720 [Rhodopirellula sp.]|nr:hypothetical protein [Rhodopirellula sp.]